MLGSVDFVPSRQCGPALCLSKYSRHAYPKTINVEKVPFRLQSACARELILSITLM